ncbi:MAG: nucleoside phosphorylase [Chloroflexota bacterium]
MTDRVAPPVGGELGAAPILELDADRSAVLEPRWTGASGRSKRIAGRVVLCFFQDVIEAVVRDLGGVQIGRLSSEIGHNPIWSVEVGDGVPVAVVHPGVGAPLAAAFLEELIPRGGSAFVACGGAGVLVPELAVGHVMVPTTAVRDEGTSYHYLPASRTVDPTPVAQAAILDVLRERGVPYVEGATWTTDAIYRETRGKVERRVAEGCISVEMEAAALFAVAAFRGVTLGQMLYAGDDLSGPEWDQRGWDTHGSARRLLFELALEAVLRIPVGE